MLNNHESIHMHYYAITHNAQYLLLSLLWISYGLCYVKNTSAWQLDVPLNRNQPTALFSQDALTECHVTSLISWILLALPHNHSTMSSFSENYGTEDCTYW